MTNDKVMMMMNAVPNPAIRCSSQCHVETSSRAHENRIHPYGIWSAMSHYSGNLAMASSHWGHQGLGGDRVHRRSGALAACRSSREDVISSSLGHHPEYIRTASGVHPVPISRYPANLVVISFGVSGLERFPGRSAPMCG